MGIQMSGIKKEDFVLSNYSPLCLFAFGREFKSKNSLSFGYQGRYFYLITDNEKHLYNFYFMKSSWYINSFLRKKIFVLEDCYFDFGIGVFNNQSYNNFQIHAVSGISRRFQVFNNFFFKFNLSSIIGWDIYQGNKDILPSISLGLGYDF